MKTQVLFVDDETNVLQGIQRMLRSSRTEWDLYFAESGTSALQIMSQRTIDVIVSDMRMPGMSGAEFLSEAMRLYPATVRIVLSGHADKDLVAQCIGVAHQYISKPCQADELKTLIANASLLSSQLVDAEVKRVIGSIDRLPGRPSIYLELKKAIKDPDVTDTELGDIISQDQSMTVKVLKLVNSAFFGLRRSIETPHEAVSYLGIDTIQHLVLAHGVFDSAPPLATKHLNIDQVWRHSIRVAEGARRLAELEGLSREQQDESFIGGILHDVGMLVLAMNFPQAYDRIFEMVTNEPIGIPTAEKWEFGITHSEVGAYLLGLWGIPSGLLQIVSLHHRPNQGTTTHFSPLIAVHLADVFSTRAEDDPLFEHASCNLEYVASLGDEVKRKLWIDALTSPDRR